MKNILLKHSLYLSLITFVGLVSASAQKEPFHESPEDIMGSNSTESTKFDSVFNWEKSAKFGEVRIFATVTAAEQFPEGIATYFHHIYVGTTQNSDEVFGSGDGRASKVLVYNRFTGQLIDEMTIKGESPERFRGIGGLATDAFGRVYAVDLQGRILRLNFTTRTQETYAIIPDLPVCDGTNSPCTPTADDLPPLPNDLTFDLNGNLYVTDSFQHTIFRIAPGNLGQDAEIWFQDSSLDTPVFGLNGIRISPEDERIYFSETLTGDAEYLIWSLPLVDSPSAETLRLEQTFPGLIDFQNSIFIGADGIAFDEEGSLFVTTFGGTSPVQRISSDNEVLPPIENSLFADPSSMVFDLFTKTAFLVNHSSDLSTRHILQLKVDEKGAKLARPIIP